jgi:hypothetical protein
MSIYVKVKGGVPIQGNFTLKDGVLVGEKFVQYKNRAYLKAKQTARNQVKVNKMFQQPELSRLERKNLHVRNMATLELGRDPSTEEIEEWAEREGEPIRKAPKYVANLIVEGAMHLMDKATKEEMAKESEDGKDTWSEEAKEKSALYRILKGMEEYKEKNETQMYFHLMYWQEIKLDVEERLLKPLDWIVKFSCKCITSEGQIHYHALIKQNGVIRTKDALKYQFKKARAIGEWPVKAYKVTHMQSDLHFVHACIYACLIKAGRDHGPHSDRLIPLTEMGGKRVWNQVAEKYQNLYKEKVLENQRYRDKMSKKKIIVDNL